MKKIKVTRRTVQIGSVFLWIALLVLGKFEAIIILLIVSFFSSLLVGRAFCSWLCPFGTVYELSGVLFRKRRPRFFCRYVYPCSVLIGLSNRISLLKVRKDEEKCIHCGLCDDSCPVGLAELGTGYDQLSSNPSKRYACVRCLNCVSVCPSGALSFKFEKDKIKEGGV